MSKAHRLFPIAIAIGTAALFLSQLAPKSPIPLYYPPTPQPTETPLPAATQIPTLTPHRNIEPLKQRFTNWWGELIGPGTDIRGFNENFFNGSDAIIIPPRTTSEGSIASEIDRQVFVNVKGDCIITVSYANGTEYTYTVTADQMADTLSVKIQNQNGGFQDFSFGNEDSLDIPVEVDDTGVVIKVKNKSGEQITISENNDVDIQDNVIY